MATSQDIRTWAAEQGIPLKPKGPPTKQATQAYYAAHGELDTVTAGDVVEEQDEFYGAWGETDAPEPESTPGPVGPTLTSGEKPPSPGKSRWRDRLKRKAARKSATRGRASTEKLLDLAWGQMARLFDGERTWATANVLRMQSPVAGAILDAELRGTAVDAVLQPVARMVNRSSAVGSLVALPFLVQLVSMRPDLYPRLEPLMVDAVYSYLEVAGPAVEKKRKANAKRAEQYGQDAEEFLRAVFTPPPQYQAEAPVDAAAA